MKKNKMMRIASVLLVAVILTTCAISGTFAKYVTSDNAEDNARVAKFGVTVTAAGSLYGKDYVDVATGNTPGSTNLTVKSSDTEKLVAPGTKSSDAGLTFAVTGKPEVKVQVDVVVNGSTFKDVFLKAKNDLPDMTTGNTTDTFDNGDDYYPVKYTLTKTTTGISGVTTNLVENGTLSQVKTALEDLAGPCEANTDLSEKIGTLKLTWAWDFDNGGAGTYDKQDTLLGDLAADPNLANTIGLQNTEYNLNSSIDISITVTQID